MYEQGLAGGAYEGRLADAIIVKVMKREEVEALSYAEARKARWDLVRGQVRNPSSTLAARSAEGGQLGFTRGGGASAFRRCNSVGEETSLNPPGRLQPRLSSGDIVFFDVTGPHCGPGVTEAEKGKGRTVLYLSWVGQAAMEEGGGAPCMLRAPGGGTDGVRCHECAGWRIPLRVRPERGVPADRSRDRQGVGARKEAQGGGPRKGARAEPPQAELGRMRLLLCWRA